MNKSTLTHLAIAVTIFNLIFNPWLYSTVEHLTSSTSSWSDCGPVPILFVCFTSAPLVSPWTSVAHVLFLYLVLTCVVMSFYCYTK